MNTNAGESNPPRPMATYIATRMPATARGLITVYTANTPGLAQLDSISHPSQTAVLSARHEDIAGAEVSYVCIGQPSFRTRQPLHIPKQEVRGAQENDGERQQHDDFGPHRKQPDHRPARKGELPQGIERQAQGNQ